MRSMSKELLLGWEDEHLGVVWKPHGILTSGNSGKTLRHLLRVQLGDSNPHGSLEPAHRLDFGTSGWVIFGKNERCLQALNEAFRAQVVRKSYWALVHGELPHSLSISLPLDGKTARTDVLRKANGRIAGADPVSLGLIQTTTGRTHQIRRHLHQIGHGVVGDDTYVQPTGLYRGKGLFLCAHAIRFTHPITKQQIDLSSHPSKKFMKIPWVYESLKDSPQDLSSQS